MKLLLDDDDVRLKSYVHSVWGNIKHILNTK